MTTIEPATLYWFTSSSGTIEFQLPGECVADCSQSGDNGPAVDDWLTQEPVAATIAALDPDAMRDELRGYGAWDDEQLADDDANRARVLWISCHDIAENVRSGDYTA